MTTPRPPAHIAAYVEVLGVDLTIRFLLAFGGAEVYLAANPSAQSAVVQLVGLDNALALATAADARGAGWQRRVPTGKPWIARVWHSQGLSKAEISRRLHTSDVTVRKWLHSDDAADQGSARSDPRQASFL